MAVVLLKTNQYKNLFSFLIIMNIGVTLSSDIPNIQLKTISSDTFNIESSCGSHLKFNQNRKTKIRLDYSTSNHASIFMTDRNELFTCVTSSDANCLSNVVLPALSRPRSSMRTSFSGAARSFRSNDNKP